MVFVIDVPVETCQSLGVSFLGREIIIRSYIIPISIFYIFGHLLHVGDSSAGNVPVRIHHAVGRRTPGSDLGRSCGFLEVYEEEEFVLDDRAAESETVSGVAVAVAGCSDCLAGNHVTAHVLVAVVDVGASFEGVGTRLCDGVDCTSDEVGLANVIRRNHDLHLFDGID